MKVNFSETILYVGLKVSGITEIAMLFFNIQRFYFISFIRQR